MTEYKAPLQDIRFVLFDVFHSHRYWQQWQHTQDIVDRETADAILEEGAKLAEKNIAPLSREGDEQGCHWQEGQVSTPTGYKKAFREFASGGWIGLAGNSLYGGMGMPCTLDIPLNEIFNSADLSFALYSGLTTGASLAIHSHADDFIKSRFLPRLYSGEFSGTMCLTESHAGSDLGIIKTRATPSDNSTYRINGTKIFITGGEHDLTENIIHLVLAKLPDAPEGTRGISMFLIPKYKVDAEGAATTESNGVTCGSIERKMGIKASATCVMHFDDAEGYLIGEVNKGLACMFTMMNSERLFVGLQGLACAERSYQNARNYALERFQGRSATGLTEADKNADPLIVHGDVRRMLITMKAMNEAGRALAVYLALELDKMEFSDSAQEKQTAAAKTALLTPIAKAFLTDTGLDTCITGQQVFGGHGYVREWGQEQLVRDARITQIYEGTNGIQAIDLLERKVFRDRGETLHSQILEIRDFIHKNHTSEFAESLEKAVNRIEALTQNLMIQQDNDPNTANSACVEYLHAMGYMLYAWMWAKMSVTASDRLAEKTDNTDFYSSKLSTARYFYNRLLPRLYALAESAESGTQELFALSPEQF
ncbi:3-methylmercaptopropionyl-CoA dehydrogenase [invertebrate metagenome]|uniref:3-methylmercaptopropionyl-CoA dehydrogenase n=1 Tax=invertebrate metagenome TaxID=1711999 RepID=A0A2H9TA06_9ZZZZ